MQKNKIMKIIIIIGIIAIPVMYSFFYLKAFWDPYGSLQDIPLALVNLDEGDNGENLGKDLVKKLQDKDVMKIEEIGEENANTALVNEEYYATITIPKDFTKTLNNAENSDRQIVTITYSPNQKSNYLASQIINKVVTSVETELTGEINEKVVSKLTDKLNEVPDKMEEISDGATKIKDGADSLSDGLVKINDGASELNEKYSQFNDGINSAKIASKSISDGSNTIDNAVQQIYSGSEELADKTKALGTLSTSVDTLAKNNEQLNKGIATYVDTVNSSNTQVTEMVTALLTYAATNPTAVATNQNLAKAVTTAKSIANNASKIDAKALGNKLKNSSSQINQGIQTLNSKTKDLGKLSEGTEKIKASLAQLKSGTLTLKDGSTKLNEGLTELNEKSNQVKEGISTLSDGAKTAVDGSKELSKGVNTFKTEISNGISDTKEELQKLNGLSEYAKDPVNIEEKDYGKVESYGIGFAPYFMSLSLWVGSLILLIVLYYDPEDRFKLLGRNAKNKILRSVLYAAIAAIQGITLGFLLKAGLGYTVTNLGLYYGACILAALVFFSIVQFLILNFGDVGKFLAILFLVLQLAASGGTFPIETVPKFFQNIYDFMPMKYSIKLIKESLICMDGSIIKQNTLILVGILVTFVVITAIIDIIKMRREKRKNS